MKNFKISKNAFILTSSFIITSISALIITEKSDIDIISMNENSMVAEYEGGLIVMGSQDYLDNIDDNNAIKILDERESSKSDPNVKVYNSYKINNPFLIENIVDAILEYETLYPTEWDRTKQSMINEWLIHNIGFYFNYKIDHNIDVDIDNNDEELFTHPDVIKILKEKNY